MKKSHGPAFRQEPRMLAHCPSCKGRAVIQGVFHEIACVQCNASGWVDGLTAEALPLEDLVLQLSLRLQKAQQRIAELEKPVPIRGAAEQYYQNNRRGAGGTNFTGD